MVTTFILYFILFYSQNIFKLISILISFKKGSSSGELQQFGGSHPINESVAVIYIVIALLSSLCLIILILGIVIVITRSSSAGRLHQFISSYFSSPSKSPHPHHHHRRHNDKPVIISGGNSSGANSECDSIEFAKKAASHYPTHPYNHHISTATTTAAYNQLSSSGGTTVTTASGSSTSSSGGSSPAAWRFKTYIDPHTYEDPTKVVSLFARELPPSSIIIESVLGGGEFGDVCKGCLKLNPWTDVAVAIKTLKGAATEQSR